MLCPKDMQPCIDDLCRGSGCLKMTGIPMYERCWACGQLVAADGSDDCECDPDCDEHDDPYDIDRVSG